MQCFLLALLSTTNAFSRIIVYANALGGPHLNTIIRSFLLEITIMSFNVLLRQKCMNVDLVFSGVIK